MKNTSIESETEPNGIAPGDEPAVGISKAIWGYLIGFVLATGLTVVSFCLPSSALVWAPSVPIALSVLAIAQMGVHIVFFLHMTSGPDNVNNLMALAFGLLIIMLLVFGSLWIMTHLNRTMMPVDQIMQMQR
jgi:cytochrome o ubiquinol oxidase operon protein cyoD